MQRRMKKKGEKDGEGYRRIEKDRQEQRRMEKKGETKRMEKDAEEQRGMMKKNGVRFLSGYSQWHTIENLEFLYFQNFPLTLFRPQLAIEK